VLKLLELLLSARFTSPAKLARRRGPGIVAASQSISAANAEKVVRFLHAAELSNDQK